MKSVLLVMIGLISQATLADCGIQYGVEWAWNGASNGCYVKCDNGGVSGGQTIPDDICNSQYGVSWSGFAPVQGCYGLNQDGSVSSNQVADGYCGQP